MARTLTLADDIRTLRELASNDAVYRPARELLRVCDAASEFIRILDAFDAMERGKWYLDTSLALDTWHVADGVGGVITEGHKTPLAALLAAATVEVKTDVV